MLKRSIRFLKIAVFFYLVFTVFLVLNFVCEVRADIGTPITLKVYNTGSNPNETMLIAGEGKVFEIHYYDNLYRKMYAKRVFLSDSTLIVDAPWIKSFDKKVIYNLIIKKVDYSYDVEKLINDTLKVGVLTKEEKKIIRNKLKNGTYLH